MHLHLPQEVAVRKGNIRSPLSSDVCACALIGKAHLVTGTMFVAHVLAALMNRQGTGIPAV